MSDKDFEVDVEAKIVAKKAPGFKEIKFKATATSEEDLVERYTIGEFNETDDEQQEQQPEQSDL